MSCSSAERLDGLLTGAAPILALAPMQEVTNGAPDVIHQYGGADVYWTEYFAFTFLLHQKRGFSTPSRNRPAACPSRS